MTSWASLRSSASNEVHSYSVHELNINGFNLIGVNVLLRKFIRFLPKKKGLIRCKQLMKVKSREWKLTCCSSLGTLRSNETTATRK